MERSRSRVLDWLTASPARLLAVVLVALLLGSVAVVAPSLGEVALKATGSDSDPAAEEPSARAPHDSPVVFAADEAMDIAHSTGSPVEVLAQREASVEVFAHPDGTWERREWLAPRWVLTEGDGSSEADWSLVDLTLDAGSDGALSPAAYPAELSLHPAEQVGDVLVSWTVPGTEVVVDLLAPVSPMPEPVVEGARARYESIVLGVDLVIDVMPSGYEKYFVVHNREALEANADSLVLTYRITGGSMAESAAGIEVLNAAGEVVGMMPHAIGWEADEDAYTGTPVLAAWAMHGENPAAIIGDRLAQTVPVDWDVEVSEGSALVTMLAPKVWLDDPATTFPVIVDPVAYTPYFGFDTFVRAGAPDVSYYTPTELIMGAEPGSYDFYMSYLGITTTAFKTIDVISANLYLWNYWSATCTQIAWRAYWTAAPNTSSTWNNMPTEIGSTFASSTRTAGHTSSTLPHCSQDWAWVDITGFAREWSTHAASSQGIILTAEDGNSARWKRFYSADSSNVERRPHISIWYNQKPNAPAAPIYTPPAGSARATLTAVVTDPDGTWSQVRALFTAERRPAGSTGTWQMMFDQAQGSLVTNGQASMRELDLIAGYEYRFTAWGNDTRVTSASASPAITVTVPATSTFNDIPSTSDTQVGNLSLIRATSLGGRSDV